MQIDDWLLPQPDLQVPTAGLIDPDGSLSDVALAGVAAMAAEHMETTPIFDSDGSVIVPPDAHVLDHLARAWNLVDEDTQIEHAFAAETVYARRDLPICDYCGEPGRYDSVVIDPVQDRCRAFLCVAHVHTGVPHRVGAGAVYLMTYSEVPAHIRQGVDRRLQELGRELLFTDG